MVNSGVLKADQVNIVVHGHNPVVSEMVSQACLSTELLDLANAKGAGGINLVGVCCTGNELLMRRGIAMAGNHLMTELILSTGAVDMMIVDYQCIMPSVGKVAGCYHTKMISTSDKAQFPHMEHHEFHPDNAQKKAMEVVRAAVENFANRDKVYIPVTPRRPWADSPWKPSWAPWAVRPIRSSTPSRREKSEGPWASWDATTPKSNTTTAM
jgi:carbon-monoxide dehydrogenase catalytic subunit